ncbi:hypothetical protein [Amycolatopsis thailandensis]|uniref:hypothetical protein n=1 Tax=Amycolatopsis thailandensis TaxID=589330 RepID=UPI003644556D
MNQQAAGGFVVERLGAHVLIRRRGEGAASHGPVGWPAPAAGQVFVLVSRAAAEDVSLIDALPSLMRGITMGGVEVLRIGLPGLGRDSLVAQALSDGLRVEVIAPDGEFVSAPGAALYAGHGTGGSGWTRFRPGAPAGLAGRRYPVPGWEVALPATPAKVEGAIVDPVPAGLVVRHPDGRPVKPGGPAFAVPVDAATAKIIVAFDGGFPRASLVAGVVMRLSSVRTQLVSMAAETSTHAWLGEYARSLGRDTEVTLAIAGPGKRFRPFVSKIRQRCDGSQEILEAVPPPKGWQRQGAAGYRRNGVVADVVPSGLVLRTGGVDLSVRRPVFDPTGWFLYLGTPGEPIGYELLAAAEALLGELEPETRVVARLVLIGSLDAGTRALLEREPGTGTVTPPSPVDDGKTAPPPKISPRSPAMPAKLMVSSAPVATVSGAPSEPERMVPAPVIAEDVPRPHPTAMDESVMSGRTEVIPAPVPPDRAAESVVAVENDLSENNGETPSAKEAELSFTPLQVPAESLIIADRQSSEAEQTRFIAAAGEEYGEALATVNAALATWPSMRQQDASKVKADYVAVCLYLGRGRGGHATLNSALRAGNAGEVEGQVQCLASGLRRLPTHRRAVLRQGKGRQSLEPGLILTEPGFLVGSMDLDVTVPDADLDLLIWPTSARRTSELLIGSPVDEVVFFAGARFKALALREMEFTEGAEADEVAPPRVAALLRELAPDEVATSDGDLDEQDLAVLAKLERTLERRRRGVLRAVDEPGLSDRLTTSLFEWRESVSTADRSATLAS